MKNGHSARDFELCTNFILPAKPSSRLQLKAHKRERTMTKQASRNSPLLEPKSKVDQQVSKAYSSFITPDDPFVCKYDNCPTTVKSTPRAKSQRPATTFAQT
jgi:hypothetical protein